MAVIKSNAQIALMREGGEKLGQILEILLDKVKIGVTPLEIEKEAVNLISKSGGSPSFQTVGNYKWATCISVNEGVVHGVPDQRPFAAGDIVSIDIGLFYKGFHTDTSWTKLVKSEKLKAKSEIENFLKTGEQALIRGISQAKAGNRIGHISQAIQKGIEAKGFSVVKSLVGHAIGKKLHEKPQVPGILTQPIENTPLLRENMTLAIEVIYAQGRGEIAHANDDGWTLVTADGSLAGLYEQTVVVGKNGPIILTKAQK